MKKYIGLLLILVLAVGLLAGCGSSTTASPSPSAAAPSPSAAAPSDSAVPSPSESAAPAPSAAASAAPDYSQMKIGLLLSGSAKDGGWSQMAADAATTVKDKYGCTVNFSESTPATDFESTMRGYADAGYNIIVSHGSEFLDAAKQVSKDYPDIKFICTSASSGQEPNLTAVDFGSYQFGFLVGAAAALASDNNTIGIVCASQDGSAKDWNDGVADGAKYIEADAKTIIVCTGSWDDALKAKQAVDALQQQGCDTITQNCDAAGIGAIQESQELGLMNIGAVSDQSSYGDCVMISVLQDSKLGIEAAIAEAVEGNLKAGAVNMDAAHGVITLTGYTGKYAGKLTADQKAKLQDLWQQAKDGADLSKLVG